MTKDELIRYIELGRHGCVWVDIRLSMEYPGLVRTVTFYSENWIGIEYDAWGQSEGGIYLYGRYQSLDAAIHAVEEYLGAPVELWVNHNQAGGYAARPVESPATGWERLSNVLDGGHRPCPSGAQFDPNPFGARQPPE